MSGSAPGPARPLHFAALVTSAAGHVIRDTWRRPLARQADFDELEHWVRLARTLERGRFDAVFFADVVGHSAPWRSDERGPYETGFQTPSSDPSVLAGAIAYVTDHVGIAFTASIRQEHPFHFARRISALDHASKGRVAWNVVAEGTTDDWVEEYLDVTYKLWEGSWEDDALPRDGRASSPSGDGKVHPINHRGPHYQVPGPHLASPSPQRTPLLFQAAVTEADRAFAAQNAEAVLIQSPSPAAVARETADIRSRAVRDGRLPEDIKFFQSLQVITGETEAKAKRKAAKLDERTVYAVALSPRTPTSSRITGTPEQVSEQLARWQDAGVDGINLVNPGGPESYEEFVDLVAPVLRERGLMQRDYAEGTLRHKLFGRGDRLPARHPAARYRGAFAPQPALGEAADA
jgi:alkanesulfonate monooxygenase SsuD/methylene tetrahydromethanopterin reductase-like flavin-dependent oxidoreductase (luciferase family)